MINCGGFGFYCFSMINVISYVLVGNFLGWIRTANSISWGDSSGGSSEHLFLTELL